MGDDGRLQQFLRERMRSAGRTYARARQAYSQAQSDVLSGDLPSDRSGQVRIVCRRYAERRSVTLDGEARPYCFESDHPDCEGCHEDILQERIETW